MSDEGIQLWEDALATVANSEIDIQMRQAKGGGTAGKLKKRKDIRNPEALAAFLGRKKFGKSAFQNKASRARHGGGARRNR